MVITNKVFHRRVVSTQRFVGHLQGYAFQLRDPHASVAIGDGDQGSSLSKQFTVEFEGFLRSALRVSGDALLEPSVLRRLTITDLVVIFLFLVAGDCSDFARF